MHGEAAKESASALDTLLAIDLETLAVEEWSRCKTGVGENSQGFGGAQGGLDAEIKPCRDAATCKGGMSEKEVEITVICVGSKARGNAVRLGNESVKMS